MLALKFKEFIAPVKDHLWLKLIAQACKWLFTVSSLALLLSAGVWLYFIALGFAEIGHLPRYGDPEVISFDGLDRQLLLASTTTMFYGIITWVLTLLLIRTLKIFKPDKSIFKMGLVALVVNLLIIFSPCFTWALD